MSHQRISPWRVAFEALVGAAIIVVLFRLGQPPPPLGYIEQEPIAYARPTTEPPDPDHASVAQQQSSGAGKPQAGGATPSRGLHLSPLTFRGPEGVIVLAAGTNFDAVDAHCARKLLALVSREGAGEPYARYWEARFGAAVRACPALVVQR